jgi:hypothetical protein
VSAPNEQARPPGPGVTAGRLTADGKRVYRLVTPQVIWWIWVAVLALAIGDLVFQGHSYLSLEFLFGALTATGLVFACTLWPRVIAHGDGITVHNPFRVFDIPWGAVKGIYLADSVEVKVDRGPEKKDKTIYSWALSSPRRARARAQLRGLQWDQGKRSRPSTYDRLPGQAKAAAKMTPAEVMAREMAGLSEQAHGDAVPGAQPAGTLMSAHWAWVPVAAIVIPGIAFAVAVAVR